MQIYKTVFLAICFIIWGPTKGIAQGGSLDRQAYTKCDTISKKEFKKKVNKYLKIMKRAEAVSTDEIIEIIKTLFSFPWVTYSERTKKNIQFLNLYNEKYLLKASEILGSVPLKGGVAYSREYKLYLTAPLTKSDLSCHNYYFVK